MAAELLGLLPVWAMSETSPAGVVPPEDTLTEKLTGCPWVKLTGFVGGGGGQSQGCCGGRETRSPFINQVRRIDGTQTRGQIVPARCRVSCRPAGNYNPELTESGRAAVGRATLADYGVVPRGHIVKDATRTGDGRRAGIAACSALCRHWVKNIVGVALAAMTLVHHRHDARKDLYCCRGPRSAFKVRIGRIQVAGRRVSPLIQINVHLACDVEGEMKAFTRKHGNVRDVPHIVRRPALPVGFGVASAARKIGEFSGGVNATIVPTAAG